MNDDHRLHRSRHTPRAMWRRAALALALGLACAGAQANIYVSHDASGNMVFTNVRDGRLHQKLLIADPPGTHVAHRRHRGRPVLASRRPRAYDAAIERAAQANQVEPALIHAVISAESGYNPRAVSAKGAIGLMQVLPETAHRFGIYNLFDPSQNIQAGARYLKFLLRTFHNNLDLAIAAYNAGEGAVQKSGNQIPRIPETVNYVPKVLQFYERYRASAN